MILLLMAVSLKVNDIQEIGKVNDGTWILSSIISRVKSIMAVCWRSERGADLRPPIAICRNHEINETLDTVLICKYIPIIPIGLVDYDIE